ncbi:calmin-like [Colossoma macropomum]|uniref:calmin-like n=1 Tax=Colossoma macropomum TaxID=42526 RepID=UPI001863C8ED|nr:calmin-like [Colossoma macropomum]
MLDRFRPSTHRIFTLSNIAKVLEFLEDRNVRVVNIDAADIADGRPSVILALIWNIIVYFQLKEVTGNLERRFSSSVSSLVSLTDSSDSARSSPAPPSEDPCSTLPSKRKRTFGRPKYYRSRSISTLLSWTQTCTAQYGVEVHDFGKSWRSGLALLALVKCARPELVDMKEALTSSPRENIIQAFREAQHHLGVPPLLEPEDVMMRSPDEQSIITYVAQFLQHFPENRDVHVSTLSLEEYNPSGVYGRSSLSYSSLVERDFSSQQFDISSSYRGPKSAGLLNGGSGVAEKSSFSNGQYLHSSIEGHCWNSTAQKKSLSASMEDDDGGLSDGSEEGIHILPELDSDEEVAYKYILELDHEELKLHNELNSSPTINAQKAHHISNDFHQADGKSHHLGPFLEIQKQSRQPWSEGRRETLEEHPTLAP